MIEYTTRTRDSIDIAELAAFTYQAYSQLPIPYKRGETQEEITNFLSKDCPDVIVHARTADELLGWAGLYLENAQANLLSWHPLVIPPDPATAQQLVRECIQHTAASGRKRMEVLLLNLTPAYRDYAAQCGAIYQAAGMVRGSEWQSMQADLQQCDFVLRDLPETLTLHPLTKISNDELWSCFDAAFSEQQSTAQRRENFEAFFCRQALLDDDTSLALVDGETIVGFVAIGVMAEDAYVIGIGVIPAYRRQGLATSMLGTSIRRAAANQCKKMILQVDAENRAALGLYRSLGFQAANKGWVSYLWEK